MSNFQKVITLCECNKSKGFAPIYLLIGLVVLMLIGGAYYYGKSSSTILTKNIPSITQSPTPYLTSTPSPTSNPSPSPTQNQIPCGVNDISFCQTFALIQPLIANKDFNELTSYIDLTDLTCLKDGMGNNIELCNNVADGGVVQGYAIGLNQSEGAIVPKGSLIKYLNSAFSANNYEYRGNLVQNDKGEIVYLTSDKKGLFVLRFKKVNSNWRIQSLLFGVASDDYINLDPVSLSYIH